MKVHQNFVKLQYFIKWWLVGQTNILLFNFCDASWTQLMPHIKNMICSYAEKAYRYYEILLKWNCSDLSQLNHHCRLGGILLVYPQEPPRWWCTITPLNLSVSILPESVVSISKGNRWGSFANNCGTHHAYVTTCTRDQVMTVDERARFNGGWHFFYEYCNPLLFRCRFNFGTSFFFLPKFNLYLTFCSGLTDAAACSKFSGSLSGYWNFLHTERTNFRSTDATEIKVDYSVGFSISNIHFGNLVRVCFSTVKEEIFVGEKFRTFP